MKALLQTHLSSPVCNIIYEHPLNVLALKSVKHL